MSSIRQCSKVMKDVGDSCSFVTSLSNQWRNLRSSFWLVNDEIERKQKLLVEREDAVVVAAEERLKAVAEKEMIVEKRFKAVEAKESEIQERFKTVQSLETEENGVQERVQRRFKEVIAKENEVEKRFKTVYAKEKEVEKRCKTVETKENGVQERFKAFEEKEKRVQERFETVEGKENDVKERFKLVEIKEKRVEERVKAFEKRLKAVSAKENEFEERVKTVEAKEKEIEERVKVVERKEKLVDEHCEVEELRQEENDQKFIEIELEKRRVDALVVELERRESEVEERLREVHRNNLLVVDVILKYNAIVLKEKELNEVSERLELKEKELNDREKAGFDMKVERRECVLELKENEIVELKRELELKESKLNDLEDGIRERERELELRENRINELRTEVELRQKEVNEERARMVFEENRVSRVRMEIDRRKMEHELKEKKLKEDLDSLKEKERLIQTRLRELDLVESKKKEVSLAFEDLEVKKKLVVEYSSRISLVEKLVNEKGVMLDVELKKLSDCRKELELREKQSHELSEALKLRRNEINSKALGLEAKQKDFEKHCLEYESRQKEIDSKALELEVKQKEFEKCCLEHESRQKEITRVSMMEIEPLGSDLKVDDGENLQLLLNDKIDEHCFMGEAILKTLKKYDDPPSLVLSALNGFFEPHLKKGNVVYTATIVRSSCLLLLEQLMNVRPEVCEDVKVKAEKMAGVWRQKMQENGESRVVVLGFLIFIVAFQLTGKFERDELKRLWEIIEHHRLAPKLRLELNLFEECEGFIPLGNRLLSQPDIEQRHSASAVTDNMNCSSEIQSACRNMDADFVRSYLNKHVMDHKLFPQKIVDALKSAPDPTTLVFKVLQCFNLPQSSVIDKTSCIFLLEQLMKLQKYQSGRNPLGKVEQMLNPPLQISQDMKINALAFASRWKQRLTDGGSKSLKPLEVYGFLQFLASYKLASLYDGDELLQLFKVLYDAQPIYWPEENPQLCRALSLSKKIPGLIRSLIKEDCRLQAAKYICAFLDEPHFPLALLLKDHVKFIKKRVEKIPVVLKDKNTQKMKTTFELLHLREVVQYINDYKLDQEYSPTPLESRIEELEAVLEDLKTIPAKTADKLTEMPVINSQRNEAKQTFEKPVELPVIKFSRTETKPVSVEKSNSMTDKNWSTLVDLSDNQRDAHGGTKRHASSPTSEFPNQDKRLKVDALESPNRPNITFKIPSAKNPFSSGKSNPLLPRKLLQTCSLKSTGNASPSETATKSTSTPGAVYSVAVAPYGEDQS